jgi:hypothetical protein
MQPKFIILNIIIRQGVTSNGKVNVNHITHYYSTGPENKVYLVGGSELSVSNSSFSIDAMIKAALAAE